MNATTVFPVTCHTDHVGSGTTFVAISGYTYNGIDFIAQALRKGAKKIVIHQDVILNNELLLCIKKYKAEVFFVSDTRKALAQLSAQASDYAAKKLKIIGITGTKGKTTSAFFLEHCLKIAGYKTALLSTVKNSILDREYAATLTTQQPDYLHVFFKECVHSGVEYVVMEVAAQALTLHRTWGLEFDGILFTNFGQEHAEFYVTQEAYFAAKCLLLEQVTSSGFVVLNGDDAQVTQLADKNKAKRFSLNDKKTEYYAALKEEKNYSVSIILHDTMIKSSSLMGVFNAYNILGVCALLRELGVDFKTIQHGCATFSGVPGRLEKIILSNNAYCFVDYAHNPSSYTQVLSLLRSLTNHLIVVFGAGGGRDTTKRPVMGAIAAQYADVIILTSDNPRQEDLQKINDDIIAGINVHDSYKVMCVNDREQAIKVAYAHSCATSIIAVLGKGPDEYQIIGTEKKYFSDKKVVQSLV